MINYKTYDEFYDAIVEAVKTDKDVYINEFCMDDDQNFQKDEDDEHYHEFYANTGISFEKITGQLMYEMQEETLERKYVISTESFWSDDLSITRMYITSM